MCVILAIDPENQKYLDQRIKDMLISNPGPYWIINGYQEMHGEDYIEDIQLDNEEWLNDISYSLLQIYLKDYFDLEIDNLIKRCQSCLELVKAYETIKANMPIVYKNTAEKTISICNEMIQQETDMKLVLLDLIRSSANNARTSFPDKIYRAVVDESMSLWCSSHFEYQAFFVNRENAEEWLTGHKRFSEASAIQEIIIADINDLGEGEN